MGGKQLTAWSLVLGHFLGKQRQQHSVPIFVSRQIKLALGDQPSKMLDVCVVDKALHRDLHGYVGGTSLLRGLWVRVELPIPATGQTQSCSSGGIFPVENGSLGGFRAERIVVRKSAMEAEIPSQNVMRNLYSQDLSTVDATNAQ